MRFNLYGKSHHLAWLAFALLLASGSGHSTAPRVTCGEETLSRIKSNADISSADRYAALKPGISAGSGFYSRPALRHVGSTSYILLSDFKNSGFTGSAGDSFTASAAAAADAEAPAVVSASGVKYLLHHGGCNWNGSAYDVSVYADRESDCSGGSPCYIKQKYWITNSPGSVSCADATRNTQVSVWTGKTAEPATVPRFTTNGSLVFNQTSESAYTETYTPPFGGSTHQVVCYRVQDTSSVGTTPGVYSRWVRYEMAAAGSSCSYGYEDTVTRCEKGTN
jgi:hypothetical protein